MPKKQKIVVLTKPNAFRSKPNQVISIQIRLKERDTSGKLIFKDSKGITATGITLEETYKRILKMLTEEE